MQNNVRFIKTLPSLPDEIDVVVLQPKQDSNQKPRYRRQFERNFHIRRSVVEIWLRTLKRYHSDYKHIAISNERLPRLLVNGSVADEVIVVTEEELRNSQEAPLRQKELVEADDTPNVETVIGD
jgi:hypothetical protein